ncbi:MAG TPA: histidine kinase N-terminal 7TM domain-containing protein [Anaerolineales bacterium]|nr:histidine kinase N-terminal 7TM domain-containing protein [Anaerolineales bacterium]
MAPFIVPLTAIESAFGFALTSTVLYFVIIRGRQTYHYLFAAFLLTCALWDLGVFLMMVRNQHPEEVAAIGRIIFIPCLFIPALVFHFANLYSGRPVRWAIVLVWIGIFGVWLATVAGLIYQVEGTHAYDWGNVFRVAPSVMDPLAFVLWIAIFLSACWLLVQSARSAPSRLQRRHKMYVVAGLLAVTFAIVKTLVTMGINAMILLPLGMLLNDVFVAIIGVAIIKDRLFDITIVIKKGTLYSILAGLLVFVYSLSEHILVTYIGETVGEGSTVTHLISIAVSIAVLMPVKSRLESTIESYFEKRRMAF